MQSLLSQCLVQLQLFYDDETISKGQGLKWSKAGSCWWWEVCLNVSCKQVIPVDRICGNDRNSIYHFCRQKMQAIVHSTRAVQLIRTVCSGRCSKAKCQRNTWKRMAALLGSTYFQIRKASRSSYHTVAGINKMCESRGCNCQKTCSTRWLDA